MDDYADHNAKPKKRGESKNDGDGTFMIILIIFLIWSCSKLNSMDDDLQRIEQKINRIENGKCK